MSTRVAATSAFGALSIAATARVAYASVFLIALPALLWLWMQCLDRVLALPACGSPLLGGAIVGLGIGFIAAGTAALWVDGGGLPMSPFPPARLATRGAYRLVAHPIYLGAVLTCAGVAVAAQSPAGLWIVSPVLAAAAAAFVIGYERDATRFRLGSGPAPLFQIPPASEEWPRLRDRASMYVLVLLPWVIVYEAVSALGVPPDARSTYMRWEEWLPVIPWTEAFYVLAYPYVLLGPMVASRRSDLRRFAMRGLGATAAIACFYLLVPLVAPVKPLPSDSLWTPLMRLERLDDHGATSLPAFHVIWVCIASALYVARWPRARWIAAALTGAIAASCVTTGMHASLDVVAGLAAFVLIARARVLWTWILRASEGVANSWREWSIGSIRLMSHGAYAAIGAAVGVTVAAWIAGPGELGWIVAGTLAAVAGAALWAQLVEGSPQLLRPYGYFGSIIAAVAVAIVAGLAGCDGWLILAALAVGGCFTQAFGRLRCLVQGCCHGREVDVSSGIHYAHARSRVLRLSQLGGVPLHPTQVYSIACALVTGAVLLRLWHVAAPLPFIAGAYLILIGLGRFVEEHFRGEPQTMYVGGLRLYQWLATAFVACGAALTAAGGPPAPAPATLDRTIVPIVALVALVTYVAYGVDFPRSNRRFSRLV